MRLPQTAILSADELVEVESETKAERQLRPDVAEEALVSGKPNDVESETKAERQLRPPRAAQVKPLDHVVMSKVRQKPKGN